MILRRSDCLPSLSSRCSTTYSHSWINSGISSWAKTRMFSPLQSLSTKCGGDLSMIWEFRGYSMRSVRTSHFALLGGFLPFGLDLCTSLPLRFKNTTVSMIVYFIKVIYVRHRTLSVRQLPRSTVDNRCFGFLCFTLCP